MTEAEFRFMHSELIEYYQNIEMRLKGICAVLCVNQGTSWLQNLDDYESDPFGKLLQEFRNLQKQSQKQFLSPEEFQEFDELRKTRNFWVHQCFAGNSGGIAFHSGELKKGHYGEKLKHDLDEAKDREEKITDIEHWAINNASQ